MENKESLNNQNLTEEKRISSVEGLEGQPPQQTVTHIPEVLLNPLPTAVNQPKTTKTVVKKSTHGGKRAGAGRKSKAQELKLMEKLKPMEGLAFKKLKEAMKRGEVWAIKLYFAYQFGRPREIKKVQVEHTLPVFEFNLPDE